MRLYIIGSLILLLFTTACQVKTNIPENPNIIQTGGIEIIPIQTPKGMYKVWTKKFGNNPNLKVLLLPGGPSCTHEYMECFESFFPQNNIEFYYYDQLGTYFSDQPKDSSLWDLDRFVNEVEQVRQALGLDKSNFVLLGHSWGGILATQYALKYQQHLKGLVISNMMASCPKYGEYANNVLSKTMKPEILSEIKRMEAEGLTADTNYMNLLMPHFYKQHICRLSDWPDPVNRTMNHINPEVYVTMQGPSEFGISGRLANWDRSADLKNIKVPTLTIGGKYDTMDPEYMKWMASQMPLGKYLYCPKGSHMSFYDDQHTYFDGLIKFLKPLNQK